MADGSVLGPEQLLERFLFPRAMHDLRLSRLSGGELRRIQLVRLLADSPQLPIARRADQRPRYRYGEIELLEDFLSDFPGCVLAVSHDRAFLDGLVDFPPRARRPGRRARNTSGATPTTADFVDAAAGGLPLEKPKDVKPARGKAAASEALRERKGLCYAERKELEGLMDEISGLEDEKAGLEHFFSSSSPDAEEMEQANRRYSELVSLVEECTAGWEPLSRERMKEFRMKPNRRFFLICLGALAFILLAYGLLRMKFGPFLPPKIDENLPNAVIVGAVAILLWNRKLRGEGAKGRGGAQAPGGGGGRGRSVEAEPPAEGLEDEAKAEKAQG